MQATKRKREYIVAALLLFLSDIGFFLTLWLLRTYHKVSFDQILFQLKSSSSGVYHALAGGGVLWVGGWSVLAFLLEAIAYVFLSGEAIRYGKTSRRYLSYQDTNLCRFFQRKPVILSAAAFLLCVLFFAGEMDVAAYAQTVSTKSDFIEDNYAPPGGTALTFPEKKRNLIYIFLESMESTYADTGAGGPIAANYIPELTAAARENISFSNTSGIGGALSFQGTTWTAAAMVSQTSGIPIKVPVTATSYGEDGAFLPGAVSIGEILEKEGYNQTLLLGSDANFHGRRQYFTEHGNYTILDTVALKDAGRLDKDYQEWWGFEDEKLFAYAREELTRLASLGEPFNLTLLTADTHFPDGYRCRLCGDSFEEPYANVLSCSSRQVSAFLSWVQAQPFYENTAVVISGDHLTMDTGFLADLDQDYVRTVYNCILNPAAEPVREKGRQFGAFDLFPTTLAALGVKIEGERLGLGTNLFSSRETLSEEYGFDFLNKELQKKSEFYNREILKMDGR